MTRINENVVDIGVGGDGNLFSLIVGSGVGVGEDVGHPQKTNTYWVIFNH